MKKTLLSIFFALFASTGIIATALSMSGGFAKMSESEATGDIYPTTFDKSTTNSTERYLKNISLKETGGSSQKYPLYNTRWFTTIYHDGTSEVTFNVTAGHTYTPYVNYEGRWMHAYTYIDYDRDGQFENQLISHTNNNNVVYYTLAEGSELVSYSTYATNYTGGDTGTFYDSNGESADNNTTVMPSFTIPSTLKNGIYRMRYKVDWNNLDAGGNDGSDGTGNSITSNGGAIVDILLNVTGGNSDVKVTGNGPYRGTIYDSNHMAISTTGVYGTYNTDFPVRMSPPTGLYSASLKATYKTNSTTDPGYLVDETVTYTTSSSNYNSSTDVFTVPASVMYDEVVLTPDYTEDQPTLDDDVIIFTGGSGGTKSSRYVKCFGFTMPNDEDVSSYETNAITISMKKTSVSSYKYYLVISSNNIANATTIPAEDVIAVSSNYIQVEDAGNQTFNFSNTLKFRPNTTYYAYFTISARAAREGFTPNYAYLDTYTSTYQPTTYSTLNTTPNGTYAPTTAYRPSFSMTLTKKTVEDPYVDGELQTLWSSYNADHPWRIPAITRTIDGTLIACGGYLVCDKDVGNGECHIYSKYSTDNGVTWSRNDVTVAHGSGVSGSSNCGYGDAAIVADRESNLVLVLCAAGNVLYSSSTRSNPIRVARIYGVENSPGDINWDTPEDITSQIYGLNTSFKGLFFASGRICQSRVIKVDNYYRLYSAILSNGNGNYVLYSDDFGESWHLLGGVAVPPGDEAKVEEMPNGDIFISSRTGSGRYFNLFKFTDIENAEGSWGTYQTLSLGSGTATNGEILFVNAKKSDGKNCILALQSMPSEASTTNFPRQKVRIYWREVSQNDLSTLNNWTSGWSASNSYQVSHSGSAYSTMVLNGANKISFLLENNYYDVDGKPRSDLQHVSLPISTITNGAYTDIISEYVIPYRTSYTETIANNNSDMRFDKVTINREDITDTHRYYTMCLPFDMTEFDIDESELADIETLSGYNASTNVVNFEQIDDYIHAFNPYVIKSLVNDGLTLTGKNALILKNAPEAQSVTVDGATFHGNLVENYNLSQNGSIYAYGYSATTGKFVKASSTAKIHAYCAYITLPNGEVKSLSSQFESDETATGIEAVTSEQDNSNRIYNISGQRVNKDYKGIVIINGKKYIRK